jgi:SP family galactose:H+ symporter-like MFS transporter
MQQSATTKFVYMISVTAALAGLLFGIDTGVISGALPFVIKHFNTTTSQAEYVVSAVLFGAFFGTLMGSYLSKRLGRKIVLFISGIVFTIGCLLSASAQSVDQLIFYRIILGLSVGMAAFIAPIYLSEMAPRRFRGGIVSMYQVMVYLGILIAFISDTYFSYTGAWRWMLGIICIPAIIMAVLVLFLPRSPRWLILKNYKQDASEVLHKIRDNEEEIERELKEIEASVKSQENGFSLLRTNKPFRKVVGLGVLIQVMQQFTGINMTIYYAPKIFGLAGFAANAEQMWMTVLMGVINVIACAAAIFFVDHHGRKPLLYWGYLGMAISMCVLALAFALGVSSLVIKLLAVVALFLFLITFAFSSGPIAWLLCAEIFPLRGRDFGMATATCANWICNFILASFFLTVLDHLGAAKTFSIFAVFNAICLFFIFYLIPETKGVSLETIEKNLLAGKNLRDIGEEI